MRLNNVLYVTDHRSRISTSKSTLHVRDAEGLLTRVPMRGLSAVVLLGQGQITSQAMGACVKQGIPITSLTRSGRIRFHVRGGTSGNVELRRGQMMATIDEPQKLRLARSFVAGKLQSARRNVQRWRRDARSSQQSMFERRQRHIEDRLSSLATTRDVNHVRGLEGDAARQYFRALGGHLDAVGLSMLVRSRRPPRDVVNSLLSFTYGLVTAELVGALTAVGLDPQIGYLHEPRPGRPALALDLLEELRTGHADRFVVRSLMRRELTADDFETRPGGAVHLTDVGRKRMLALYERFRGEEVDHRLYSSPVGRWLLPHAQSILLARHLRGDIGQYPPYVAG